MSAPAPTLPASCDRCRKRKVKCDRQQPCSNCRRKDAKCIVSTTTARPRGREGGRKSKRSTELQARIAKLEALVNAVSAGAQALPESSSESTAQQDLQSGDPPSTTDSKLYRYAAGPVWSQLSSQIEGLREILLDTSEDEESSTQNSSPGMISEVHTTSERYQSMLLCSTSNLFVSDLKLIEHPILATRQKLFTIYERNVDPLCRVFHKPTLQSYIFTIQTNALVSPEEAEAHAALFAMYGAAVLSMPEEEYNILLKVPRDALLHQFCFAIEFYLIKADYLESRRLGPLQAFVIYILIIRFIDQGQKHWVLVGLAIQLARALGLHSAKNIQNFPPLQHELRCRLWHALRTIDFRAAMDRGTECVITPESYDTHFPRNLNDADLFEDQVSLPNSREDPTDMSLALVVHDGVTTMAELYHMKPVHLNSDNLSSVWVCRRKTANELERRLKERIMKFCDKSSPLHWQVGYVVDAMVTFCQLLAIRPMSRIKNVELPQPEEDSRRILNYAISSLREEDRFFQAVEARGFRWFYWVHWYVLAVALVEIGSLPSALFEGDNWVVVEAAYDRQSHQIADTSTGPLWKPLKKLMSKLHTLRQSMTFSQLKQGATFDIPVLGMNKDVTVSSGLNEPQAGNEEGPAWNFNNVEQNSNLSLIQPGIVDSDLGVFGVTDPFIHWDEFLGDMTNIDPFAFWNVPQ